MCIHGRAGNRAIRLHLFVLILFSHSLPHPFCRKLIVLRLSFHCALLPFLEVLIAMFLFRATVSSLVIVGLQKTLWFKETPSLRCARRSKPLPGKLCTGGLFIAFWYDYKSPLVGINGSLHM